MWPYDSYAFSSIRKSFVFCRNRAHRRGLYMPTLSANLTAVTSTCASTCTGSPSGPEPDEDSEYPGDSVSL